MLTCRMDLVEANIDRSLVARLVERQFLHWSGLSIAEVPSSGTDHAIYRLGDDMAVRLPRRQRAAGMVGKEQRWLPLLAPLLPLAIPVPLGFGAPADGFPYPWTVCRWLAGEDLAEGPTSTCKTSPSAWGSSSPRSATSVPLERPSPTVRSLLAPATTTSCGPRFVGSQSTGRSTPTWRLPSGAQP